MKLGSSKTVTHVHFHNIVFGYECMQCLIPIMFPAYRHSSGSHYITTGRSVLITNEMHNSYNQF